MSTRTRAACLLVASVMLAVGVSSVVAMGQRADAAEAELYAATHQTITCEGVRLVLETDRTDAHQFAKDHCGVSWSVSPTEN